MVPPKGAFPLLFAEWQCRIEQTRGPGQVQNASVSHVYPVWLGPFSRWGAPSWTCHWVFAFGASTDIQARVESCSLEQCWVKSLLRVVVLTFRSEEERAGVAQSHTQFAEEHGSAKKWWKPEHLPWHGHLPLALFPCPLSGVELEDELSPGAGTNPPAVLSFPCNH